MKLIIFYLNFLFLFILGKYTHHTKKKLHHRNVLTPKADDLNNHFGYHPFNSPYGPQEKKLIYVSSLEPQPVYNLCEITVQPYYDDCSQLSTCGLCATSPYCGWCQSVQLCLPGSVDSCSCSSLCPDKWYYSKNLCPQRVFIERRVNYVSPEIAKPKLHVISQQTGTIRQTAIVGTAESHDTITTINEPTGEVVDNDITTQTPIYGTVDKPFNIIKKEVVNLDGSPQTPQIIKYHGVNA